MWVRSVPQLGMEDGFQEIFEENRKTINTTEHLYITE